FDGLGMGDDGTFWGGEVLVATLADYRRVGRFGRASMPGGALAVKKPYRMALGYLLAAETFEQADARSDARSSAVSVSAAPWLDPELTRAFLDRLDPREVEVVRVQLARDLNAPVASSAGRLFDAAASLLGIRDVAEYEAQAAVELELLAEEGSARPLPYAIVRKGDLVVYDPRPTIRGLLEGVARGEATPELAARFQQTIAAVTHDLCVGIRSSTGLRSVVLSGGVFQNQWLATTLVRRLSGDGFEAYTNRQVPANDGGISYGQAAVAAARLAGAS
ncbi:MAG: carbamoyltransferase HypF, partial [Candidatus Limnocylindrales bacterium]